MVIPGKYTSVTWLSIKNRAHDKKEFQLTGVGKPQLDHQIFAMQKLKLHG